MKRENNIPECEVASTSKKNRIMKSTDESNSEKIERLVFWPCNEIPYVRETLENLFEESQLHVEFHVNELMNIPEKTWKHCGPKIRSVTWYSTSPRRNYETTTDEDRGTSDSTDSDEDQSDDDRKHDSDDDYHQVQTTYGDVWWSILLNCPLLEYFEHRSDYKNDECSMVKVLSKQLLQKLIEANIVHEGVRTLREPVSLDELETGEIFQVFPNLTQISLPEEQHQTEEPCIIFSKLPATILQLHFSSGEDDTSRIFSSYIKSPYVNIKLKELKADVEFLPTIHQSLLKLFNQLNELEVVELSIFNKHSKDENEFQKFKNELIICILNNCNNLTKLIIRFELHYRYTTNKDDESSDGETEEDDPKTDVYENLAKKIFALHTFIVTGFGDIMKFLVPAASTGDNKLQRLCLCHISSILCSYVFKNITYLHIGDTDLNEMRKICKFQENLKTLDLGLLKETDFFDDEPTGVELMKQLKRFKTVVPTASFEKLEHLEMGEGIYMMFIILNHFNFPSLKHLVLTENDKFEGPWNLMETIRENMDKIFECLPQKVPLLEMFHSDLVYNFKRNLPAWCVKFVKKMYNLEILSFSVGGCQYPMTTNEVIKVYKMQPKLKLVINESVVFYNRKTRKIVTKNTGFCDHNMMYTFKRAPCCDAFN